MTNISEDDLEKYGFMKMVSNGSVILTKMVEGKELICKYNLRSIHHIYAGKEISREDFWNLTINGKI